MPRLAGEPRSLTWIAAELAIPREQLASWLLEVPVSETSGQPAGRIGKLAHHTWLLRDVIRILFVRRGVGEQPVPQEMVDTNREKGILARAQRERIEIQNEISRRNLIPTDLAQYDTDRVLGAIVSILEGIPMACKRQCPELPQRALDVIRTEIARCRNEAASIPPLNEIEIEQFAEAARRGGQGDVLEVGIDGSGNTRVGKPRGGARLGGGRPPARTLEADGLEAVPDRRDRGGSKKTVGRKPKSAQDHTAAKA